MLDPARMEAVLRRGNAVAGVVADWRGIDARRRALQGELDALRQQKNVASERMSSLDKKSAEFATARDEMKALGARIKEGEGTLAQLETQALDRLFDIPNAPHESVPDGAG